MASAEVVEFRSRLRRAFWARLFKVPFERQVISATEQKWCRIDHPVCAAFGGFAASYLLAQPPLLFKEGKIGVAVIPEQY
jgi:hypothetical protein